MTNNEYFKHLLFLTGLNHDQDKVIDIFEMAGNYEVSRSKIRKWRASDPDSRDNIPMSDEVLRSFMTGLYKYRDEQAERGIIVFNFNIERVKNMIDNQYVTR